MKNIVFFAPIGLILLILIGCATPHEIPPARPVITGKPASLDIILVSATNSLPNATAEASLLGVLLTSGLKETKMFERVTADQSVLATGSGIKIQADITEIKKVTDEARNWIGILAGQARVRVQVTISDFPSDKPVVAFEVVGKSRQSAYAGTTAEALQRATDQIVAEILRINASSND